MPEVFSLLFVEAEIEILLWQGRLIPGARIETLPFVEAIRAKRSAAARDILPDEVFCRIRGALFFGPEFLVTRNKLSFRDNLSELLQHATSGTAILLSSGGPRMS